MTSLTSINPQYTLIRGCSLMSNRRSKNGYILGNVGRNLAVTSPFQRSVLLALAQGLSPLADLSPEHGPEHGEDLAHFIERLDSYGFLNRRRAQLQPPQRYLSEISDADIAAAHLRSRSKPELAQSEWIDGCSDGGTSTLAARSTFPIVLSGRSRVITLVYSMLLASGVVRVRFADRFLRPKVESTDIGFGVITHQDLGMHYYEQSETARRAISLFPIEFSARLDLDTESPAVIVHYGDCDPADLVEWTNNKVPHLVIHHPVGDEIVIGPLVIPCETPCLRCFSLFEIDNFGFTRSERIPLTSVDELPVVTAHYVAAIVAAQILHFIDQKNQSEFRPPARNLGIGEVSYINFQNLSEPQVVAIARHPLCGCDH